MYYPNTWGDDAQAFLQIYDSLVAAANTSATIETWPYPTRSGVHRSSGFTHPISPSVPRQSRRIVSASSDAPPQRRSVSRRDDPNFDFFPYIMAIMCGDSIDAPDVKTKDAFGEIVRAADTVSQMFGPQWFVSLYCHKYAFALLSFKHSSAYYSSGGGQPALLNAIKAPGIIHSQVRYL